MAGIDSIYSGFSSIDDDFYEEIEEILVMGDIGINTTTSIIEHLKEEVEEKKIKEPSECKQLLIDEIKRQMDVVIPAYEFENRKIRCAGDRCQRCGKNYFCRKTGRKN